MQKDTLDMRTVQIDMSRGTESNVDGCGVFTVTYETAEAEYVSPMSVATLFQSLEPTEMIIRRSLFSEASSQRLTPAAAVPLGIVLG